MFERIFIVIIGVLAIAAIVVISFFNNDYTVIEVNGVKCVNISEGEDAGLYCEPGSCLGLEKSAKKVEVIP